MKIKKAKREIKVLKEIKRETNEVKKRDVNVDSGEGEGEAENGKFSNGNSMNGSSGRRTAPVLQAENQGQTLEGVAETAPRRTTNEENTPRENPYAANYNSNYSARYENRNYEPGREAPVRDMPTIRASGALSDARNFDFEQVRRQQNLWNSQDSAAMQQRIQDRTAPSAQNYQPRESTIDEQKKLTDKRRRMM